MSKPVPGQGGIVDVFSTRLRRARNAAGMSQQQLASKAGLSTGTVWRLESAKTYATLGTVEALAQALDLPVEELL